MGPRMKITITSLGGSKPQEGKYANAAEERELSFPNIPNPETRRHVESVVGNNPARYLARGAAQVGAGIAGTPGNIASLGGHVVNESQKLVTGKNIPGHETVQKYLPTSENLIKGTERATGLNLGGGEKANALDRFISGTATLASGGVGLGRAAKIAGAGQAGRESAKYLGAGEAGQIAAEIGSSIAAGKLTSGSVKSRLEGIRKSSYDAASKGLPENVSGDATKVNNFLKEELNTIDGIRTKAKSIIKKPLQEIANGISNKDNILNVKKAIKYKQDVNDLIGEISKDYQTPKKAVDSLKRTVGTLNEFIKESTEKAHPEFWKNWDIAESLSRGLAPLPKKAESAAVEISKEISKKGISGLIGFITKGGFGALAGPLALRGFEMAVAKSKQFKQLLQKSPLAKEEYSRAVTALATDNIALAAKSLASLNDIAEDFEAPINGKITITSI
jgi:hypothetical protein